jgi:chemotaxis protein methyltransferase CheR
LNSQIDPKDYQAFQALLEDYCGIVLGPNKQYLVSSRLKGLMEQHRLANLGALVSRLNQPGNVDLRGKVVDLMTTNETQWFRDEYPFSFLKEVVFPELHAAKKRSFGIWSSACSTGQEPYSMSIAFEEFMLSSLIAGVDLKIMASDISPTVLEYAKQGQYQLSEISRGLTTDRRNRYFARQADDSWRVKPDISGRISFRMINLLENFSYAGRFDVIFCRNVLIYFSTDLRKEIIDRMVKVLNPRGYLVLGASESLGQHSSLFEFIRYKGGLIYRLK